MKNYLIIGGSSGIGYAIAKQLSKENKVIVVSRTMEKLEMTKNSLQEGHCEIIQYDCNDVEHIGKIFEVLNKSGLKLDGMIYSAGMAPLCLLEDNTVELLRTVYNVNFFSFIECCRYFYMEKNSFEGSKIIAVSSVAAHKGGYRQVLYGSSKAAIISAVKLMALELYNRKITINCISPGCVDTQMLHKLYKSKEELEQKTKERQPLGVIPAEDVAKVMERLLLSKCDYMTGTEIVLDGGLLLK